MNIIGNSEQREWTVTLSADVDISQVQAMLAQAGLHIDLVLEEIGVITGHGSAQLGEILSGISGVADVAEQVRFDIGPPDYPAP